MTTAGAWATTLTGFAAWYVTTRETFGHWISALPVANSWRLVWRRRRVCRRLRTMANPDVHECRSVAGTLVSLVSPPTARDKLDLFYGLMRTPIQPGEVIDEPCTLPAGVALMTRPMLLTWGGLEIPRPSRTSCIGFFVGWLCVVALIVGFIWIVS